MGQRFSLDKEKLEEIESLFLKSSQKENNKLRPFQELQIFRRQIILTI